MNSDFAKNRMCVGTISDKGKCGHPCKYKECETGKRHACLPGDPYSINTKGNACHPLAVMVRSTFNYTTYKCPVCGEQFTEYEDDMK